MSQPIAEILPSAMLFEGLQPEEYTLLAKIFVRQEIPGGTEFIQENDIGDELFVIIEGRAEVFMRAFDSDDRKIPIARLNPFDSVGEFALVRTGARRTASAYAYTKLIALKVAVKDLEALFDKNPRIGMVIYRNLFRTSVERLAATSMQLRNALV